MGSWPAWQLSRPEVSQVMQSNTRKTTRESQGTQNAQHLIGGQIALTLLMLAGAGAAIEGFLKVAHTNLGYDPHNVMSVGIPIHDGTYKTWPERAAYFEQLHDKVAQIPGVSMAAISSNATPPDNGFTTKFEIVGKPSGARSVVPLQHGQPGILPCVENSAGARTNLGQRREPSRRSRHRRQSDLRQALLPEWRCSWPYDQGAGTGGAASVISSPPRAAKTGC